ELFADARRRKPATVQQNERARRTKAAKADRVRALTVVGQEAEEAAADLRRTRRDGSRVQSLSRRARARQDLIVAGQDVDVLRRVEVIAADARSGDADRRLLGTCNINAT